MKNGEGWGKPLEFCLFGHLLRRIVNIPEKAAGEFMCICSSVKPNASLAPPCSVSESRIFKNEIFQKNSLLSFCMTFT